MERKYMMHNPNSQEQTIYRILADQIQFGFYDDGEQFPSARDIANRYQVSYCPAQRALKMLENDGLIKLNRGKATSILSKQNDHYVESEFLKKRAGALTDLSKSLKLILPSICYQSMFHIGENNSDVLQSLDHRSPFSGRQVYQQFEKSLKALGNQTALSLYYDVIIFAGIAFLDVLYTCYGESETIILLQKIDQGYVQCVEDFQKGSRNPVMRQMEQLIGELFDKIGYGLKEIQMKSQIAEYENLEFKHIDREHIVVENLDQESVDYENIAQESFCWEPRKGRTRYCDIIAIDMVCKINQGIYPIGELLPGTSDLADLYHVSEITIRRTIGLLNKLGVTRTRNGVGTLAIAVGEPAILYNTKGLMLEYKLKTFLEALQLLIITSEPVFRYVFPYIPEDILDSISEATSISDEKRSLVATLSAGLQAVVHYCPLAAIREIYGKITLLLLNGSILRVEETGEEPVAHWSRISHDIQESLRTRDSEQFARAFRELSGNNFDIINMKIV
ncbi:GntR family transcriptional regulator [uncultured Robinsoniella sp.]|uniref:GntR family transcriptional regulator n=1 Tax=uncultured Robinsoniella sp. TaxID=904190 RepID=UPI00374E694C